MWHRRRKNLAILPPIPWNAEIKYKLCEIIKNIDKSVLNLQNVCNEYKLNCEKQEEQINILNEKIDSLEQENKRKSDKIRNSHDIIARLYQDIEDKDEKISQCLSLIQENSDDNDNPKICQCCCEVISDTSSIIRCTLNHIFCINCVNTQCGVITRSLNIPAPFIKCCGFHECKGIIDKSEIIKTLHGENLLQNFYLHELSPKLLEYFKKFNEKHIEKNINFLKIDGGFRALQCPICSYGPILHANCAELDTHHGQKVDDNIYINNACPSCNKLHKNVMDLIEWNGI